MQTLNTYSFNELSNEAKQVAFNNNFEIAKDKFECVGVKDKLDFSEGFLFLLYLRIILTL